MQTAEPTESVMLKPCTLLKVFGQICSSSIPRLLGLGRTSNHGRPSCLGSGLAIIMSFIVCMNNAGYFINRPRNEAPLILQPYSI